MARVAVIQRPPVCLDREAALARRYVLLADIDLERHRLPRSAVSTWTGHLRGPTSSSLQVNDRPQQSGGSSTAGIRPTPPHG